MKKWRKLLKKCCMGRTKKLDSQEVRRLASLGCPIAEIAQKFGVSFHYIENRYLPDYLAGKADLNEDIREAQLICGKTAKGSATMLIWLGKMYLGQKETQTSDRVSDIDKFLNQITDTECSSSVQNNLEVLAKQHLASMYGSVLSDPEKATQLI